jgi:2-aminoadipate transaminase
VAGEFFYPDRGGKNTMRMSFSFMTAEKITEGVKLLASLLKDELANIQ